MAEELSQDDIESMLTGGVAGEAPDADAAPASPEMPDFGAEGAEAAPAESDRTFDLLMDVNLNVKIELGKARMVVEDVLKLKTGSVVPLDKLAGDPVDVLVNDKLVARGEIVVINDVFCVRVTEILDPKQRLMTVR